jgi:hypothetical protein
MKLSALTRALARGAALLGYSAALIASSCGDSGDDEGPESCTEDGDCDEHSTCEQGRCLCNLALCPGACVSGRCFPTECSTSGNRCQTSGYDLCDATADECYPSNGRCTTVRDCPSFQFEEYERQCPDDGFCHYVPRFEPDPLIDGVKELAVLDPVPGRRFDDVASTIFSWPLQAGPVIVTVSDRRPLSTADLGTAFWAASLPPGSRGVAWEAGASPAGAAWTRPAPPPPDSVLYLVAVAYKGAAVESASRPIRFRIGGAWPVVGSECGSSPADCDTPSEILTCDQGRCARACLSNSDCAGIGNNRCGEPTPTRGRRCAETTTPRGSAGEGGQEGT